MATEVQGIHVGIYFRDNGTTQAWKRLVCEETLFFDLNNDVNTTKTKCGIFKGIDVADFKCNGSGVCNISPTSVEMSYDQLVLDQQNITKKDFRIQNEAYGSVGLSDQILLAGSGYFVQSQFDGSTGQACKFTWTFEGTGTVETHES